MRLLIILFALFLSETITAQIVSYSGTLGKTAIDLDIDVSSSYVDGVYVYKKYDTPIGLTGEIKTDLVLEEQNSKRETIATLVFKNYDSKSSKITGEWRDVNSKKTFAITLSKNFETKDNNEPKEILQVASSKNHYFKFVLTNSEITGVSIYQKRTDKLIQKIEAYGRFMFSNISVGDFNFDGKEDFSIFEESYAGPNTSSSYYLFNPTTKQYFKSSISGISLEFDAKSKTIIETNQCCAGTSITKEIYTLKNNKMILKERHCYKWDEEKQDHVEKDFKECN